MIAVPGDRRSAAFRFAMIFRQLYGMDQPA